MENGSWPARAEFTPRARPRSGPKPKRPARPQTALRVPGRHAARDGNRPTGLLALSASRAPGRNLGLGRESLFPPRPKLSPVIVSHPSQSNGCARFPAEQNRARRPRANPSPHSVFLHSHSRVVASDSVGRRAAQRKRGSVPEVPP
jgi:hypothetical protein